MADTTIDSLQIEINAKAQTANDAIDALVDKLDLLSNSLGKINGVKLNGFAESLNSFKGSKIPDFTRLANGIKKLSQVNYAEIELAGNSVRQIADQLQSLKEVKLDDNVMQIANVANAMSRLGGKSIVNATANVPLLANALNQLMVTLSKAPTVNQSVIDMTHALANLAAQGSKVGSASKSVVNGLNRTNAAAKRTASSTMSLARAFGKFYANYFLLVRGFKGLFKSMESAMELTETVNYFERTLEDIGKKSLEHWKDNGTQSAKEYAESFAKQLRESTEKLTGFVVDEEGKISQSTFSGLGLNPATTTQYTAMFAQVANSIGMTAQASTDLSEAFVRLGADWASLRNVDFEVAYEKLASGLAGQSRALRAFGIDITMATLQEIAFANGIEKSVSEMTQSEKAYLRLIAIIEQSEVAFGDLARTLYSPANQMRMLSQGVKNLATLTGNLFLPIMSKALPILNGFVIAMQRIVIAISEAMGIDTSGFNTSLGGMTDNFEDVSGGIDEATESAEKFNRATRGWDELNVLGKDTSKGYGVGNDLVENEELMEAYDDAIEKYRKAWNEAYENINNEAEDFADKLLGKLNVDKIAKDFSELAESIGNIWDALAPFLSGFVGGVGGTMFSFAKTVVDFFGDLLSVVDPDVAKKIGESIGIVAGHILAFKGVTSAFNGIKKAADGIKLLGSAFAAHPILTTVGVGFTLIGSLKGIFDSFSEPIEFTAMEGLEGWASEIEEQTLGYIERIEQAEELLAKPSDLQLIYERWKEIASKVGELTDDEKGLLRAYADQIVTLFPEAKKYLDENGQAYAGMASELDSVITKQLELYRVQGMQNYVQTLVQSEIEIDYNIKDLERKRGEFFDRILQEYFPSYDKTQHPLYGLVSEYELQEQILTDLVEAVQSGAKIQGVSTDNLFGAIIRFRELQEELVEFSKAQEEIERQQQEHKEIQDKLSEATKGLMETQKDYNASIEETTEAIKDQGIQVQTHATEIEKQATAIDSVSTATDKANEKMGLYVQTMANVINSMEDIQNFKFPQFDGYEFTMPSAPNFNALLSNPSGSYNAPKVSPVFDLGQAFKQSVEEAILGTQSNVIVTFDVKGDPNGIFKVTQQEAYKYTMATGRSAYR